MEKLNVLETVTQGVKIGLKNFLSILGAVILWILTIWIPYLNVGTTIAIATLPIELSKGRVMSPLAIFDAKYRLYMGEFFVLQGLKMMALLPAMLFLYVPAVILGISWSLSTFLLIDKGLNPSETLVASNQYTNGNKWRIFFSQLLLLIPLFIPFLNILYLIIFVPCILGVYAYIYGKLVYGDVIISAKPEAITEPDTKSE